MQSASPVQTYTDHLAAVKAIAWSPHHHGLLASGGGTADRCIRFWNTLTGQPMQCVDTGILIIYFRYQISGLFHVLNLYFSQKNTFITFYSFVSFLQVPKCVIWLGQSTVLN